MEIQSYNNLTPTLLSNLKIIELKPISSLIFNFYSMGFYRDKKLYSHECYANTAVCAGVVYDIA